MVRTLRRAGFIRTWVTLITGLVGQLPSWCPPEELKLDVVGVAEGKHCVPRVRRLLDTRMGDSKRIETLGPLVQICSICDQELKVVKSSIELVEGVLGSPRVLHQTDFEPRARL